MINLLNLDQLAHKAHWEDNALALAILDKLERLSCRLGAYTNKKEVTR